MEMKNIIINPFYFINHYLQIYFLHNYKNNIQIREQIALKAPIEYFTILQIVYDFQICLEYSSNLFCYYYMVGILF